MENGTQIQFECDDFSRCSTNCQVDILLKNLENENETAHFNFFNDTLLNITGMFELDSTRCGRFRLIASINTKNYVDDKEIAQFNSIYVSIY